MLKKINKDQLLVLGLSYFRAVVVAITALYMVEITDLNVHANAFLVGLIGPILRIFDPVSKDFARKCCCEKC